MKHIHSFNEYRYNNVENVDEGVKDWFLGSLMALGALTGFAKGTPKVGKQDVDRTHYTSTIRRDYAEKDSLAMAEEEKSFLKRGWTKLATDIDTLWEEIKVTAPDTTVYTISLKLDNKISFGSGQFEISQSVKEEIDSAFERILDQSGVLTGVEIVSSTDKTPLSPKLKTKLRNMKLPATNAGLSKARSNSVKDYLVSGVNIEGKKSPINDTLIKVKNLSEQGYFNDPTARYVYVNITYLSKSEVASEREEIQKKPITKSTVYWQKEFKKIKKKKYFNLRSPKFKLFKLGKISNVKQLRCPKW